MSSRSTITSQRPLRLGFAQLVDAAPIVVAQEQGIFKRHGLQVRLTREVGWASIREKLIHGELDAAHTVAGIPITLGLGIGSMRCEVAVPLVLNLQGIAITLASEFSKEKVGHGEGLRDYLSRHWKRSRPFVLAVSHPCSTHGSMLYTWLTRVGMPKDVKIVIVTLPSFMMPRLLESRLIDGYCSAEPWNSEAILAGTGWSPARSTDLARHHPESFLTVHGGFLGESRSQVVRMVAALIEACELCQAPHFRNDLVDILSRPEYIGSSPEVLLNTLGPRFDSGVDRTSAVDFHLFRGRDVNRPSQDKASWALAELRKSKSIPNETCGSVSRVFREDLYSEAELQVRNSSESPGGVPS